MIGKTLSRRIGAVIAFGLVVLVCHVGSASTVPPNRFASEALSAYRKAIELNPSLVSQIDDSTLRAQLGQLFLDEGTRHLDAGKLSDAERLLLLAGNFLDSWELYTALARCYSRQERWQASLVVFGKALERAPSSPIIKAEMARSYVRVGKRDLAIKLFSEAITSDVDTSTLIDGDELRHAVVTNLVAEARNLASRDRHVDASARMKAALRLSPTPELYFEIGEVFVKARNQSDAARAFALAVEERPSLIRRLRNRVLRAATARTLFQNGVNRHSRDEVDQARTLFELSFQLDETAITAYNIADCAVRQGRLDDAVKYYRRAISLDSNLLDAHLNLALVYVDRNLKQQAMETLRKLIRLSPGSAEAYDLLAKVLCSKEKRSEAAEVYQQAMAHDPLIAKSLTLMDVKSLAAQRLYQTAVSHYQDSRIEESLKALQGAEALRPSAAHAFLEGNIQYALRNLSASYEAYQRALRLEPEKPEIHNNLGNLLMKKERHDEAVASFREAVRINPSYAQGYNNLGICLRKKGLLREAIAAYRRALSIEPDYAAAHFNLGNALAEFGNTSALD